MIHAKYYTYFSVNIKFRTMKNGLQKILAEISSTSETSHLRIRVITTYNGKSIHAGEMDDDPNIRKILPKQNEFNIVYRQVIAAAQNNMNLYEIYVSEKGISWSKVDSFTQL